MCITLFNDLVLISINIILAECKFVRANANENSSNKVDVRLPVRCCTVSQIKRRPWEKEKY